MRLIRFLAPIVMVALAACSSGGDELARHAVRVDAPIESIEIHKIAAKPPNASMTVVTGLRNGCEKFDQYSLRRTGDLFSLTISNLTSEGPDVACTDDYRTVTTNISLDGPLYGPIEECKRYAVEANGEPVEVFFSFTSFMESDSRACGQ